MIVTVDKVLHQKSEPGREFEKRFKLKKRSRVTGLGPFGRRNTELERQMQRGGRAFNNPCKRAMDIAGAILGVMLLSPVFMIIAVITKLDSKGPIIHGRSVSGRDDRSFYFYKFRPMIDSADEVVEEWKKKDFKLYQEYMSNIKLEKDLRALLWEKH